MMIGIDKKRHETLQERIEQLSAYSKDNQIKYKHTELETKMLQLSEQFFQYNALMQKLAATVENYTRLYNDTSIIAYQMLRKTKLKRRT